MNQFLKVFGCLALIACMIGGIIACTVKRNNGNENVTTGKETEEITSTIYNGDVERETEYKEVKVNAENLLSQYSSSVLRDYEVSEEFKKALNKFTFDIYNRVVQEESDSAIVSPLSAYICLAMFANGTSGESRAQMEKVLGMDIDSINENLYALINRLYFGENCKVNIADSFWFRDADGVLKIKPDYLQLIANWYDAEMFKEPFDEDTLNDINNWVKNNTDGLIPKLLDEISDDSMIFLINTVLFDAKWQNLYEDFSIRRGDVFYNYDGTKKSVDMLVSSEYVFYRAENCVGTCKDFYKGKYSFVTLLPNKDVDIYDFIKSLKDGESFNKIISSVDKKVTEIVLKMPEFKTSSDMELADILKDMGIQDIFTPKCDVSRMAECKAGYLYVSNVRQKATIEVSRTGAKAAAATIIEMKCGAAFNENEVIEYITLDRPYVYAIVDNSTWLPIFVGANINMQ